MKNQTVVVSNGVGLMGLLFITLFVMKIIGYVNYSWWIVTAPLWGPPVLIFSLLFIVGIIVFLTGFIYTLIKKKTN